MDERATNLLNAHHEKVAYLVAGGWNTLFQYRVSSLLVRPDLSLAPNRDSVHLLPHRFGERLPRVWLHWA